MTIPVAAKYVLKWFQDLFSIDISTANALKKVEL